MLCKDLLENIPIPQMVPVRQHFPTDHLLDIPAAVAAALEREGTLDRIQPGMQVAITGGSVYVRVGNGTNYRAITTLKAGMTFDHVATARNGWNAIAINGQVGWVSGKYSKVI